MRLQLGSKLFCLRIVRPKRTLIVVIDSIPRRARTSVFKFLQPRQEFVHVQISDRARFEHFQRHTIDRFSEVALLRFRQ